MFSGDADVAKGRGPDGTVGHDLQVMCPSCDFTVDMFVDTQAIIIPLHPATRLPWLSKASLSPVTFPPCCHFDTLKWPRVVVITVVKVVVVEVVKVTVVAETKNN